MGSFPLMLAGRFIYALGGEGAAVAQSVLVARCASTHCFGI